MQDSHGALTQRLHYHRLHNMNILFAHMHNVQKKHIKGGQQCLFNPGPNLIPIYPAPRVKVARPQVFKGRATPGK